MKQKGGDPCIYTSQSRSQRAAMVLKKVKYGIEFHFELTGLKNNREDDGENKHYNILKRRLEKGKTYYVRVRAFSKDSNGKQICTAWSTAKKVTIKK